MRTSQQTQADDKADVAEDPLLGVDAAGQHGHDFSADAALLEQGVDAQVTAAPDQTDSAAASGKRRMSPFAWLLLAAALTVKSSAGAVFASMLEVGAVTVAAWRMQLAAAIMLPVAVWQYLRAPADVRLTTRRCLGRLAASGALLAAQWGAYAWAVGHTSLAHTLLFLSATPVLLAGWHWASRQPIFAGELSGCGVGVIGAGILSASAHGSGSESHIAGDAAALLGAAANGASLSIGRVLLLAPYHVPVFVYSFVVTGTAGVVLAVLSVVMEGARPLQLGPGGVFGWLRRDYLLRGIYLSVGPGLFGHAGFNVLMTYEAMSPLVLTLAQTLDPVIGSMLGWGFGLMAAPGLLTYAGGGVLLGATAYVTVAGGRRRKAGKEAGNKVGVNDDGNESSDRADGLLSARI